MQIRVKRKSPNKKKAKSDGGRGVSDQTGWEEEQKKRRKVEDRPCESDDGEEEETVVADRPSERKEVKEGEEETETQTGKKSKEEEEEERTLCFLNPAPRLNINPTSVKT